MIDEKLYTVADKHKIFYEYISKKLPLIYDSEIIHKEFLKWKEEYRK